MFAERYSSQPREDRAHLRGEDGDGGARTAVHPVSRHRPEDIEVHPLDQSVYVAFTDSTGSGDGSPDILVTSLVSGDLRYDGGGEQSPPPLRACFSIMGAARRAAGGRRRRREREDIGRLDGLALRRPLSGGRRTLHRRRCRHQPRQPVVWRGQEHPRHVRQGGGSAGAARRGHRGRGPSLQAPPRTRPNRHRARGVGEPAQRPGALRGREVHAELDPGRDAGGHPAAAAQAPGGQQGPRHEVRPERAQQGLHLQRRPVAGPQQPPGARADQSVPDAARPLLVHGAGAGRGSGGVLPGVSPGRPWWGGL